MNNYGLRVEYVEYVVKKGDSLYSIAKAYNTNVSELTDINMLTSTNIYPGQVLLVPKNANPETDYYFEDYRTKRADTIESIARRFNVDAVTLGLYNDFGKLILGENQIIKIPKSNIYVVKKDDTVDTILSNTNRTAEQLLKANSNQWLNVGTKIYL